MASIDLANINFCPAAGGGGGEVNLEVKTAEMLLSETTKTILPSAGYDGLSKVTVTHAPVEERTEETVVTNGSHVITPSEGFDATQLVVVDVNVPIPEVPSLEDKVEVTFTENNTYNVFPSNGFDAVKEVGVTVNVDTTTPYNEGFEAGKTEGKTEGIAEGEAAQKAKLVDLNVTENGTYTKEDGYGTVNVEISGETKTVDLTQNGTFTVNPSSEHGLLSSVTANVKVPIPEVPTLEDKKTIDVTANGTYNVTPSEGYDAVKDVEVTVNVAGGGDVEVIEGSVTITENGTTTVEAGSGKAYSKVDVNTNIYSNKGSREWFKNKEYRSLSNPNENDFTSKIVKCAFDPVVEGLIYCPEGVPIKTFNYSYGMWEDCIDELRNTVKTYVWSDYRYLTDTIGYDTNLLKLSDDPAVLINNSYPTDFEIIGIAGDTADAKYTYSDNNIVSVNGKFAGRAQAYSVRPEDLLIFNETYGYPFVTLAKSGTPISILVESTPIVWGLSDYTQFFNEVGNIQDFIFNDGYTGLDEVTFQVFYSSEPFLCNVLHPSQTIPKSVLIWGSNPTPHSSVLPNIITSLSGKIKLQQNPDSLAYMFARMYRLEDMGEFVATGVKYLQGCFLYCNSLDNIDGCIFGDVEQTGDGQFGMFQGSTGLTHVKTASFPNGVGVNASNMFLDCIEITSIEKLDVSRIEEDNNIQGIIGNNPKLTDLGGFVGLKVNLNISSVTSLTHDSLLNVINEAADVTSSPKTLTLGSTNLAKLSEEEKAIATNKGWTLA